MKKLYIIIILIISISAKAQWTTVGDTSSYMNGGVGAIYADSVANLLYVGGAFNTIGGISYKYVAIWNGTNYLTMGSGMNSHVIKILPYGGSIYAAGIFTTASGTTANRIAKWNALSLSWSPLGTGLNNKVWDMAEYGGELYVAGEFTTAGGITANRIAKWDGSAWSAVGTGFNFPVYSLKVWNGKLYAGGAFSTAGGLSASRIACWDGSMWDAVGTGTNNLVRTMEVYDSVLYAGGNFTSAGGSAAYYIAKWDGTSWSSVSGGASNNLVCLKNYHGKLYLGGEFASVGGSVAANIFARWDGTSWSSYGTNLTGAAVQVIEGLNGNIYEGSGTIYLGPHFYTFAQISSTLDIEETQLQKISFSIYPNPGTGEFHINYTGDKSKATVEVYTISGGLVLRQSAIDIIHLDDLAKGVYFVRVNDHTNVMFNKLIIQ